MKRPKSHPLRVAGVAAATVAAATTNAAGQQTRGSVTIEPPVSAKVTQNLLMQTNIAVGGGGLGGQVASLDIPGTVNASGANGGDVQLPTVLAPGGGGFSAPFDTNISIDASGAAPAGGSYEGVMLVLVQYN